MPQTLSSSSSRARGRRRPSRRGFLRFVGLGATAVVGDRLLGPLARGGERSGGTTRAWVDPVHGPRWTPPAYPVPLPGDPGPADRDRERWAHYEVVDDLVVPREFEVGIVARWGDVFTGADGASFRFGYNCDYTGLVEDGPDGEGWLLVNHEYVSLRPWLGGWREIYGMAPPEPHLEPALEDPAGARPGRLVLGGRRLESNGVDLDDPELAADLRETFEEVGRRVLDEQGVSILRVRRDAAGDLEVVPGGAHKRITGRGVAGIRPEVAASFRFSGPAAALLPSRPRGTLANCSGGTTPWGTFFTCEENIQYETDEEVGPDGGLLPNRKRRVAFRGEKTRGRYDFSDPRPTRFLGAGHVLDPPLDGRGFGWVAEVDPATGALVKHTALGRFRHENVALRCEAGRRLAAYQGDDRRGGHVWKFVSDEPVADPRDPENSRLLEKGTLFVARFGPDGTGTWIPLDPETPLVRPTPEHCVAGHLLLPSRFLGGTVGVGDPAETRAALGVDRWIRIVERFTGKPFARTALGDLVRPAEDSPEARRAILLLDAFAMANAVGATPCARPEDLEVHPADGSVYVAFTDASDGSDGSPDRRIFPDSDGTSSRQYGSIVRLVEDGAGGDPAATTFRWGRFVSSGEVAERGGGFACADNLAFDPEGNLWMMTDISTTVQNFPVTRRATDGSDRGGQTFPGVFGNNALFAIPTRGPEAGVPSLFALGPMECELCGPTFTADGRGLVLSVQHPGEDHGAREPGPAPVREVVIHDRRDRPFLQRRTVPRGSAFPHGELGRAPRPSVVWIRRTDAPSI